jgi:hypothetical protein
MMRTHTLLLLNICVFSASVKADIVNVSPANLDFGSQVVTTTTLLPVVLSNPTKKDLIVSSLTITGDFSVPANSCIVLPAGQTCNIYIVFAPTATGSRTGMFSINDNANNSPQKVKLSGTGIPLQLVSIAVVPSSQVVPSGLSLQFTAIGNFNNATTQDMTRTVIWTSSANGVAAIASGGLATGLSQGSTAITATSVGFVTATGAALNGSTGLTVGPPLLQSLSVTAAASTRAIAQGMTLQFTSTGTFSDRTIQDVTGAVQWSSSDPSVAAISATGLVTGKSPGLSTITAASGSASAGAGMSVTLPALTSIAITPPNASIAVGTGLQLSAMGTFTDGSIQNITNTANWTSLDPGGAIISATGLATALNLGVVTISASAPGFRVGLIAPQILGQTTLGVGNAFNGVSPMFSTHRFFHTATLLEGGKVLLAGGAAPSVSDFPVSSVDLYDPAADTFTPGAGMTSPRLRHTATLLASGKVLIVGGSNGSAGATASAEVYDPATQSFSPMGNMTTARSDQTATLLLNGQVLITGGYTATAELYDPSAGAFTPTASMAIWRRGHTATLLGNGKVLITGGVDMSGAPTAAAELYDPATGLFSSSGNMTGVRAFHRATFLNGGKVLLTGGDSSSAGNSWTPQAEIYDPGTGLFTATGVMNIPRDSHTATLLTSGQVLIVGGEGASAVLATAEKYDPASGTFSITAATNNTHFDPARSGHTATLLQNGEALIAGGSFGSTTGVYQPRILTPPGLLSITVVPASVSISVGASQRFVATGVFQDGSTLDLMSVIWSASGSPVATIANDGGSQGIAEGIGTGTASITAGVFSHVGVIGNATLTVH